MQLSDEIVNRFLKSDKELNDIVNYIREQSRLNCSIDPQVRPKKEIFIRYGLNYDNRTIIIWGILEDYFKLKRDALTEPRGEIHT